MKMLRSLTLALALGLPALAAQAHDSFHIGINLGGPGYYAAPVVAYPAVPQVIYYDAPRIYQPAPHAYYRAPAVGYRDVYYAAPRHHFSGQWQHGGHDHRGHGHRGHFR